MSTSTQCGLSVNDPLRPLAARGIWPRGRRGVGQNEGVDGRRLATVATPIALAACAGAVDLLALAGLRGAFASVVTGNLVVVGLGLGSSVDALVAPVVAILGFAAGVAAWQWTWRRCPTAIMGPLLAEFGLLLAFAGGWWGVRSHPPASGECEQ